jgi:hypothetical protein
MRHFFKTAALFALIMMLAFWKLVFQDGFTLIHGGDMCAQTYPWFQFASYWLKKGILPLWDPFVYSGKATLGELQQGMLYPLNWLGQLFPADGPGIRIGAIEALLVLHVFILGLGCHYLARTLGATDRGAACAGIVMAVGGYSSQLILWFNIFCGFAWLPLVLHFFLKSLDEGSGRRRFRLLAAAAALTAVSLLAGHHAPAVHICVFLLAWLVLRTASDWHELDGPARRWRFMALPMLGAAAGLLSAPQMLPSAEWARHVIRWVGKGDPVAWGEKIPYPILGTTGNLDPQDLLSLVVPYLSTSSNLYVGVIVVLLALLGTLYGTGRAPRVLAGVLAIYVFLSLGSLTSLHGWLNSFIPGVWFAREVYLYLVPLQLCLALLAGFGLDRLVEEYSSGSRSPMAGFVKRLGWGLAVLVPATLGVLAAATITTKLPFDHPHVRSLALAAVYLTVFGALLFFVHTKRLAPRSFGISLIALVLLDVTSEFSSRIAYTGAGGKDRESTAAVRFEKPRAARYLEELRSNDVFRVDDPDSMFPPNYGDAWMVESMMGHGATARAEYLDFRSAGWEPGSNISALLNARYLVTSTPVPWMSRPLAEEPLYRNPRALSRAFAVRRYRTFKSDKDALAWLPTPLFSPGAAVLLTREEAGLLPADWLGQMENDDEGFKVRPLSWWTSAERRSAEIQDPAGKRATHFFRTPWGWSVGDEVTLAVEPGAESRAYLSVEYWDTPRSSRLEVLIEGGGRKETRSLQFGGSAQSPPAATSQAALDLGVLRPEEYRVSFTRSAECSANLESVRVARAATPGPPGRCGEVSVSHFDPNRLGLSAVLAQPGLVVVSETDYPGWEAKVDGRRTPLIRADFLLKAVPVPAGSHEIELRFNPRSFRWGLWISALAALALVAGSLRRRGSQRT